MKIKKIETGPIMTNAYVISDENNKGLIIDPVYPKGKIEAYIENEGISISKILLTHTHYDHVLGLEYFRNKYGAKVYASEDAKDIYNNPTYTLTNFVGNVKIIIDEFLKDGDIIEDFGLLCLKTPGHTIDSMSYVLDDNIFCGDLLFRLSVGRSDFPGGNHNILINSIKEKIMPYKDPTKIYTGHGMSTTVGYERVNNPFL
ncbi:MAG: MBL fold metallo-hydrolase [Peptoniphilaceae bacterium]|nr:MBL fold metallo-hydrolase [Peptoniphilaceae bacterium]MDY6019577.1 MBL fold metallo-hydrolase [Anaerococcus sp.]